MLAHKVNGEHPASYSDLLLAVQKLERWAEARDPLLLKITMNGGPNATQLQALVNLFPSRKLKGNCIFMAWYAIVESIGTEGDSTAGPEGGRRDWIFRGRTGKPQWNWWSRAVAQLHHLICQYSQTIPKEKPELFQVQQSWPSGERLSKGSWQGHQKTSLNTKEGWWRREARPLRSQ